MSAIGIRGVGVVSPAGWGIDSFRQALQTGNPLPVQEISRPGWSRTLRVRRVPAPSSKPAFLAHPRLRRASPISHFTVAAALEALGGDVDLVRSGGLRLGIVLCVMSGCVNYSRRFYDETLRDPATASPLVFPETVFNAPASHLGALLGTTAINYTLVGDPGSFLQGVVTAIDWLEENWVDGCVVIGAEEADWLTADAFRLFTRRMVIAEGAGALYLRTDAPAGDVRIAGISPARLFTSRAERTEMVRTSADEARRWLGTRESVGSGVLSDGQQDVPWLDEAERVAWQEWKGARVSVRRILGEGLMAAAAWQCVAATDLLSRGTHDFGLVPIAGINEHVMWAGLEGGRVRA